MKKYLKYSLKTASLFFVTITIVTPFISYAALVPCGFNGTECRVCDLQILAGNLINFFVVLTVFVAALLFLNAGVLYVTSSANTGNIAKAHKIFSSALIGLLIVLASWLIINTVMFFLYSGVWGEWNTIFDCSNAPNTTIPAGSNTSSGGPVVITPPVNPGTSSASGARAILADNNITINGPESQTSVEGLQPTTLAGVIQLQKELDMPLVITGGTEGTGGHTLGDISHANGYKIDLGMNSNPDLTPEKMSSVLNSGTVTRVYKGVTETGYVGYVNGKRVVAFDEGVDTNTRHWDIVFYDGI